MYSGVPPCDVEFSEITIRVPPLWASHPGLVRGPAGVQRSPAWHESREKTLGAGGFAVWLGTYSQAREATAAAVAAATAAALDPGDGVEAANALKEALRLDVAYDAGAGLSAVASVRRLARAWGTTMQAAAAAAGRPTAWSMPEDDVPSPNPDPAAFYAKSPSAAKGVGTEPTAAAIAQALIRAAAGKPLDVLPGEVFRATGASGTHRDLWPGPPYVQVSLDSAVTTVGGGGLPVELKSLTVPWLGAPPRVADAYVLQCLLQAMVTGAPAALLALTYVHEPRAAGRVMEAAGVPASVVAATNAEEAVRAAAWEATLAAEGVPDPDVRPHCGALFTVQRTRESDRLLEDWAVGVGTLAAGAAGFRYRPGHVVGLDISVAPGTPQTYAETFAAYVAWKADTAWDARAARVIAACLTPGLAAGVGARLCDAGFAMELR